MKPTPIPFERIPLKLPSLVIIEKKLKKLTEELSECGSSKTALPVIKKYNKFQDELQTQLTYIQIRYSLATNDPVISKMNDKCNEMYPVIQSYCDKWNKIIYKAPYKKDLEKDLGKYYFKMIENSMKVFDDKIVEDLIQENKLTSEYSKIMGSAQIEFRGGVYNTSQMGKFTTDKDDQTRHDASVALDSWIGAHEKEIAEVYDKLVHLRDGIAKKLGFKSFTEVAYLRLGRCDYKPNDVKGYRKQIADCVVPLCQKLYKRQAKRLNKKMNNMYYYDYNLSFLSGNPTPKGDEKELVNKALKMYTDMSKETGIFFKMMKDNHLLDLTARAGKEPGGYMTYLPNYRSPFIFANFNGTADDVGTLTHEVGHAFQGYMSADIKIPEYRSPTLDACEIHSMSMEFFAWPYMGDFFKEDKEKYLFQHLESAIEFLPYGITIDEFQHWVYQNPNATHEERCAKFKEIESAYTPHKQYGDCKTFGHGGYWLRQGHVFSAPFYYIEYTLAQVCALGFFNEMRKNKDKAWKKYVKLCKMGGKLPFVALLEKNHIKNPFVDGTVAKIVKPAYKVLDEMDDSKF